MIDPRILHNRLTWIEVDGAIALDCRRIMRAERERLGLALQSGDAKKIAAARDEALRVADMWKVKVV